MIANPNGGLIDFARGSFTGVSIPSKDGCSKANCVYIQQQWAVLERYYHAGKLRAIGVSNYCVSCFECLAHTMKVRVSPPCRHFKIP